MDALLIQVTIKSVYGRDTIYPANEQAERLAEMVGTKTLTSQTLCVATRMGFRLEYVDAYRAKYGARDMVVRS